MSRTWKGGTEYVYIARKSSVNHESIIYKDRTLYTDNSKAVQLESTPKIRSHIRKKPKDISLKRGRIRLNWSNDQLKSEHSKNQFA